MRDVVSEPSLTPALRVLRICLHLMVVGLLALAVVRAVADGVGNVPAVATAACVFAVLYGSGPLLRPVRTRAAAAAWWLAAVMAAWAVLLALTPDGIWLAFPLFFVQLHLLPRAWALTAVAATSALAIAGFVLHTRTVSPGTVMGPLLGASVAVAVSLGYQALYRESEQRRRLIDELTATRGELATAEHTAGVLAERERLAREIHDTLAQGLSSIQLLLSAAERAQTADQPEAALDHVRHARRTAVDNLAEARRFVRALSPPGLEAGNLPSALERLCAAAGTSSLRVHCQISGTPVDVPTPHEVALLRIAQSALANTVQHADATHLEMTLSYMDTEIALDVVDDGHGFDPGSLPGPGGTASGSGFGLTAMRARARALQGALTIETSPGRGTALAVTLPLPAHEGVGT
ncbi:sensor histidine kinase [Streptomyces sp. NPDC049970]|uniref:sensor histidine kinase n=1 Tax=Streptomyces sp. NPDC049970 TaxID=3155033 RepID=UPI00341CA4F2